MWLDSKGIFFGWYFQRVAFMKPLIDKKSGKFF